MPCLALRRNRSPNITSGLYQSKSDLLPNSNLAQVSCGARHTLAVTSDGQLFAWGDNRHGQCGLPWWWSHSLTWPSDDRGSLSRRFSGRFAKTLTKPAKDNHAFRFGGNKRSLSCCDVHKGSSSSSSSIGVFEGCGVEAEKGRGGAGSRVVLLQPTLVRRLCGI